MKAVVISRPGGPEVLEIREVAQPAPAPDQVLIRVKATALNRADLLQRQGHYPAPFGFPQDIPGIEGRPQKLLGLIEGLFSNGLVHQQGSISWGLLPNPIAHLMVHCNILCASRHHGPVTNPWLGHRDEGRFNPLPPDRSPGDTWSWPPLGCCRQRAR